MVERAADLVVRVGPGNHVALSDLDPSFTAGLKHDEARRDLERIAQDLDELQELLYGACTRSVLIVLQGADTSGKDGTIRHVFSRINPQGCRAVGFRVPTAEEAAHDFLWRVHRATPERGMIAVFNRSHYEDVLVARVRGLVDRDVWERRYEQINQFEQLLADNGTIIIKLFLHISMDEQKQRLLEREREPDKAWKLSVGDWEDRGCWDAYEAAYQDAIERCSTDVAPWYIVPADHKWFRDLAVATIVQETLAGFRDAWRLALARESDLRVAEVRRYRLEHPEVM